MNDECLARHFETVILGIAHGELPFTYVTADDELKLEQVISTPENCPLIPPHSSEAQPDSAVSCVNPLLAYILGDQSKKLNNGDLPKPDYLLDYFCRFISKKNRCKLTLDQNIVWS